MKTRKEPPSKKAKWKILLVDDHPIMREGLVGLIELEADLAVCGEAETGQEALAAVEKLKPDLVILDLELPDKHGLELLKKLRASKSGVRVLVFSMHEEPLYGERVLRAGGAGFVNKREGRKKLIPAIRQVLKGRRYMSDELADRVAEAFLSRGHKRQTSEIDRLTDREFEVFQLLGQGSSVRTIAHRLGLSK